MNNTSRRNALKVLAAATLGAIPLIAKAEGKKKKGEAAAGVAFVKVGEGMAAGVKYVEKTPDATKACKFCALYTDSGMQDGKAAGKCSLFPNQFVLAEATCASFAKKA